MLTRVTPSRRGASARGHARHISGLLALAIALLSGHPALSQRASHPLSSVPGAPPGVTAFVDVSVVPMDTDRVLSHQTVLVTGGRITALGPAGRLRVPAAATQIDGRGKFLLPGLADMHAHVFQGPHIGNRSTDGNGEISVPWADSAAGLQRLFLWLANGATTIREMDYVGDPTANSDRNRRLALQFRARAATGQEWLPHIYTAGQFAPRQYLASSPSDPPPVFDSVAAYVAAYKAAGYDFIKIHDETPIILDSILAAAKRVGIPVVGHVPPPTQVEHVLWGYRSIEHPVNDYLRHGMTEWDAFDTTGIGALAKAMARAGVWNCPTLSHYDRLHYGPLLDNAPAMQLLTRRTPYALSTAGPPQILKILQDSGVKLLLGTDETPWIGGLTRELQEMVFVGLTPYQALLTGTRNAAEYFGTLNERGTIAVGKQADLVLLTGNPLQDVRYTAQPAGVMLGGRWLSATEIARRVQTLTLPTVTDNQLVPVAPVKSYWANVVDLLRSAARPVLRGLTLSTEQRTSYRTHQTAHQAQWTALLDSLGTSDQYQAGTQRILTLLARQLADDRQFLTVAQRATFDPQARAWVTRYRTRGYVVAITGVAE